MEDPKKLEWQSTEIIRPIPADGAQHKETFSKRK